MTQAATSGARHQQELDMMANDDVPKVDFCVNVYQDMTFKAFASGLYTNPDRFKDCIAKIGIIGKFSELQNVLDCLKCTEFTPQDSLTHCTDLLKTTWRTRARWQSKARDKILYRAVKSRSNTRQCTSLFFIPHGTVCNVGSYEPQVVRASVQFKPHGAATPQHLPWEAQSIERDKGFQSSGKKIFWNDNQKANWTWKTSSPVNGWSSYLWDVRDDCRYILWWNSRVDSKKIFATHISIIAGNYRDFVSMNPVHTTNAQFINAVFNEVNEEHIFKNMYYSPLNRKILKFKNFPWHSKWSTPVTCTGNDTLHTVKFDHLKKSLNKEFGLPAKMGYKLSDKVVNPSNIERQTVSLGQQRLTPQQLLLWGLWRRRQTIQIMTILLSLISATYGNL